MGRFDGQVAWITGGGSGLGKAMALELARQGADIAVSGRRREPLDAVVRQVGELGRRALAVPCDVREEETLAAAADRVVHDLGRMDVAVANAGMSVAKKVADMTMADWQRQLEINVAGAALTVRHALPEISKHAGRIGLIGSVSALVPMRGMAPYQASKAALSAIGQTLWIELRGSGVTCTTIHPGFVDTDIARVDNLGVLHPDRRDPRPAALMWTADAAGRTMVRALYKRKREVTFTGHGKLGAFLGRHLPGLVTAVMARS